MAYRRRRSRYSSRRRYGARSSYRPVRRARRRRTSRSRAARVVIQVLGPSTGVAASPAQLGMRGLAPVRPVH